MLTIAHLDRDPRHNDPENLKAMCQRCHLMYARWQHAASAAATRWKKKGAKKLKEAGGPLLPGIE